MITSIRSKRMSIKYELALKPCVTTQAMARTFTLWISRTTTTKVIYTALLTKDVFFLGTKAQEARWPRKHGTTIKRFHRQALDSCGHCGLHGSIYREASRLTNCMSAHAVRIEGLYPIHRKFFHPEVAILVEFAMHGINMSQVTGCSLPRTLNPSPELLGWVS